MFDESADIRQIYKDASDLLHYDLGRHSFEGTLDHLSDTRYTQPALVVVGYAAYRYYMASMGLSAQPSFLAGHSMGEITALLCSGALSFSDAVLLSVRRGELMSRVSQTRGGAMAAVKELYWEEVEDICRSVSGDKEPVSIAAYNSAWQTVITGHARAVEAAGKLCAERGGIFVPLNITVASHCPFMQDIVAEYGEFVGSMSIEEPEIPVYSCLTGQLYTSCDEIEENLTNQLVRPVLWYRILRDLKKRGAGIFLEAGPGTPLGKYIGPQDGIVITLERSSAGKIRQEMGEQVKYISTPVTRCLSLLVSIPNRNDDLQEYEEGFVRNYRQILSLQYLLEKENRLPDLQEIRTALRLLEAAGLAKRIPADLSAVIKQEMVGQFPYTRELFSTMSDRLKTAI